MNKLLLALGLGACGHPATSTQPTTASTTTPPTNTNPKPTPKDDPSCPMLVAGTTVTVEDAKTGVALVFVTTGKVDEVRKRAAAFAAMNNKKDGPAEAMGMMVGTNATAAASDIQGGAKVTFTATKPEDGATLQTELHMHLHHLQSGTCKMGI